MIHDDGVTKVMERRDLDAQEKLILIDLLMREPKPEKVVDEDTGQTFYKQHMAIATDEQIAERTGISERVVRVRVKGLKDRGFLLKKSSKGRVGNRYNVKFPKRTHQATEKETRQPSELTTAAATPDKE